MSRLTDEERRYIRELVDDIARKSDEFVERQAQLTAQRVEKILREQRPESGQNWSIIFGLFVLLVTSLLAFLVFFTSPSAFS